MVSWFFSSELSCKTNKKKTDLRRWAHLTTSYPSNAVSVITEAFRPCREPSNRVAFIPVHGDVKDGDMGLFPQWTRMTRGLDCFKDAEEFTAAQYVFSSWPGRKRITLIDFSFNSYSGCSVRQTLPRIQVSNESSSSLLVNEKSSMIRTSHVRQGCSQSLETWEKIKAEN